MRYFKTEKWFIVRSASESFIQGRGAYLADASQDLGARGDAGRSGTRPELTGLGSSHRRHNDTVNARGEIASVQGPVGGLIARF